MNSKNHDKQCYFNWSGLAVWLCANGSGAMPIKYVRTEGFSVS
jgi:hypothetical protein